MAQAVRFYEAGGPEVLKLEEVEVGDPGPGEVRIRQAAAGCNFADTYFRSGYYPAPLPNGMGVEAAGTIVAVGAGVTAFAPGDRVSYNGGPLGAYSTERVMPAAPLFKLPDAVDFETAAASTMRGLSACYWLMKADPRLKAGDTILLHAAAGGVGLILVQWLKAVGATVIGTVSTAAKEQTARDAGADHVIRYREEDVAAHVREITDGQGVPVTFDGIGMATWATSLKATARRGLIVSYGNAGGPVTGVNLGILAQHGSQFVTRPTLFDYYLDPGERAAGAARVFEMLESGAVAVTIGQRYPLRDAARAHEDLEAGRTTGSTLLMP